MPNFSSLAGLEVAEKFLWGGGVVCTVIFMSNPTVVLCWGFDKNVSTATALRTHEHMENQFSTDGINQKGPYCLLI